MGVRSKAVVLEKETTMQTNLQRRNGVYYVRMRVPRDIQRLYGNKKEVKYSLGTGDPAEAKRALGIEVARIQKEFDDFRVNPIELDKLTSRDLKEVPETQLEQIAQLIGRHHLDGDTAARIHLDADGLNDYRLERIEYRDFLRETLIAKNWSAHAPAAVSALKFLQIHCKENEPKFVRFNRRLLEVSLASADAIVDRLFGKSVSSEEVVKQADVYRPALDDKAGTLFDVVELQIAAQRKEGEINEKTADEKRAIAKQFDQFTGRKLVRNVTPEDCQGYVDFLVGDEELKTSTVVKKIGFLKAMFRLAKKTIPINPTIDLEVPKRRKKKTRSAYEEQELQTIFGARIFTEKERPVAGRGEASVWLPVLALYTGARLEELALLKTQDIRFEARAKVWILDVTNLKGGEEDAENRTKRKIPVHPDLIEIGLLRFAERQKSERQEQLFHLLTQDCYGTYSASFSKWWGRYTRALGITNRNRVFHSFRHLFKHIMREEGVDEGTSRALMGHSLTDVSSLYGAENYPMKPKVLAMKKLRFPGLTIPKLA